MDIIHDWDLNSNVTRAILCISKKRFILIHMKPSTKSWKLHTTSSQSSIVEIKIDKYNLTRQNRRLKSILTMNDLIKITHSVKTYVALMIQHLQKRLGVYNED